MEEQRVMEMISVWFANTYYVSIYGKAAGDFYDQRFPTIDKAYKNQIESFNKSLREKTNPDGSPSNYYPNIMNSINVQYNTYLNVNNTPSQFIDMIARSFLPPDEYQEIYRNETQKREVVKAIILQTVSAFTVYVINESLSDIVSPKIRNSSDIRLQQSKNKQLKEKFSSLLNQKKNEYRALLVAGRNGVDISNPDARAMIPQEVVGRLEEKIRFLVEEKSTIIREKNELVRSQNKLVKQMRALLSRCRELENECRDVQRSTRPVKKQPNEHLLKRSFNKKQINTNVSDNGVNEPPEGFVVDAEPRVSFKPQNDISNMPAVQAMQNTKFKGINLVPEQARQMHNIDGLDEVDVDESENDDDDDASQNDNSDDVDDVSLDEESDMSVSDDE